MISDFFEKLNIKKPNKLLTYIFSGITLILTLISLLTMLGFFFGNGVIKNNIEPFIYTFWILMPVFGFSFYVNSGISKNDKDKVNVFMIFVGCLGLIVSCIINTWLNQGIWYLIKTLPNFNNVWDTYPELFAPAIKSLSFIIPFIGIFRVIEYFLDVVTDDDLPSAISGYIGLSVAKQKKENNTFTCSTIICKEKGTNIPIIVPEKKRYEATLVQGATGTGKTATVLLPMSALDVERKYFFREYSKKLGYTLIKKGYAYVAGPYDNAYINKHFSLKFLKPRRGFEDKFLEEVKDIVRYVDNSSGEICYSDIGVTVIENDGNYISQFIGVAKNFGLDVLTIDPANVEGTLSINPFAIEEPTKVASIIADVLNSMYEDQGGGSPGDPFFTQVTLDAFQNLGILLKEMYPIMHNGEMASLEDMLELLYNFDKVETMTEEMKKHGELEQKYKLLIAYFEKNFYKPSLNINGFEIPGSRGSGRKETERFLYGAITQLNNLLRHPGLKKALCGKTNILNFDKALKDGSLITACSRKGELGIIQSKAFGMFFIMQFQDAILRRPGNEDSRTPHFLYIDEFPEYLNKDMDVMFTLFRKYRCGVTVALQNLAQLEKSGKKHYRQTVLANTKTQIVFGDTVPEDSAYWEKAFGKEKVLDPGRSFKYVNGKLEATPTLEKKKKERMEGFKLADQPFGNVFFKTKNTAGKTVYGKGKVSFLDSKYNSKKDVLTYNFEKYMMTKPDSPTIIVNDSDDSNNDDTLFGVDTSNKLINELKMVEIKDTVKEEIYANQTTKDHIEFDPSSIDIVFEDELEPSLDNAKLTGGAITDKYETPTIKKM